jgi:YidC/Oxa1 family membrane protein insertase
MIQQYVISGWGSLANYLKFLPTDAGFFPPTIPPTALAGASAGSSTLAVVPDEEPASKRDFWDILAPLTEPSNPSDAPEANDDATEQAISNARRQAGQLNPRRRKARR